MEEMLGRCLMERAWVNWCLKKKEGCLWWSAGARAGFKREQRRREGAGSQWADSMGFPVWSGGRGTSLLGVSIQTEHMTLPFSPLGLYILRHSILVLLSTDTGTKNAPTWRSSNDGVTRHGGLGGLTDAVSLPVRRVPRLPWRDGLKSPRHPPEAFPCQQPLSDGTSCLYCQYIVILRPRAAASTYWVAPREPLKRTHPRLLSAAGGQSHPGCRCDISTRAPAPRLNPSFLVWCRWWPDRGLPQIRGTAGLNAPGGRRTRLVHGVATIPHALVGAGGGLLPIAAWFDMQDKTCVCNLDTNERNTPCESKL